MITKHWQQETRRVDDSLEHMTSDYPNQYLFESQMRMLGRMSRAVTPKRRFFARLFAVLALVPFVVGIIGGIIGLVR